jgi:hypothetical protein
MAALHSLSCALKSGIHHSVSRGGGELLQQKAQKGRPRALISGGKKFVFFRNAGKVDS